MPIFMIERQFADQLDPTIESLATINAINDEEEVRWLMSFLSADKRKSYCLYEAESPEAIRRAAARAGVFEDHRFTHSSSPRSSIRNPAPKEPSPAQIPASPLRFQVFETDVVVIRARFKSGATFSRRTV
jgi:hypothetical protein